jgi:ABC-type transport system substrate-binding protein
MNKRILALLMILVLVLGALAGCGQKQEEEKQSEPQKQEEQKEQKEPEKSPEPTGKLLPTTGNKEKNAFTMAGYMPTTLDMYYRMGAFEGDVINLLADSLYRYDSEGNLVPWLATSIEPNEDGSEVMITLRDDVYFHDGTKMTAEDVAFSIDHMHLAQGDSLEQNSVREVIDDTHLKLTFPDPNDSFYFESDFVYNCVVLNSAYYKAKYDDIHQDFLLDVNATGPYDIEKMDQVSGTIVLKKYDKYWGDRGYFDTITIRAISGDRNMAFEGGEIDMCQYTANNIVTVEDYDNVVTETKLSSDIVYLALNASHLSPLNDIRVREAATYAVDREDLGAIATSYSGVTAWNMATPDMQFYNDILPHRTQDQEKARALMKEAGYSESDPCRIKLIYQSGNDEQMAAIEILKEMLDACFFDCSIDVDLDLEKYISGDFDIGIMGMSLMGVWQYMILYYDESFAGLNFCHYEGDDLQDIINEYAGAQTQEEADKAMLHDDSLFCHIPLAYPAFIYAFNADLDASKAFVNSSYDASLMSWK